ncbi:hypothetical protein D3C75_1017980 [compost metagenome]
MIARITVATAEIRFAPKIQRLSGRPGQRHVCHMARVIIERVAFIYACFLLAVVIGVVGISFYRFSHLPVSIQLQSVDIRFAHVEILADGIGLITVHLALVSRRRFANCFFRDFVFELGVENGAI